MKIPFELIETWVRNISTKYDARMLENNIRSYYTGKNARILGTFILVLGIIALASVVSDPAKLQGIDYVFIILNVLMFILSRSLWRLTPGQKIIVEEFLKDAKNLRKLGGMRSDKKFADCMKPHWQLDKEFPQPPDQDKLYFHSGKNADAANTNCAFYCWSGARAIAARIRNLEMENEMVAKKYKQTDSIAIHYSSKLEEMREKLQQLIDLMTKFKLFRNNYGNKARCFEETDP